MNPYEKRRTSSIKDSVMAYRYLVLPSQVSAVIFWPANQRPCSFSMQRSASSGVRKKIWAAPSSFLCDQSVTQSEAITFWDPRRISAPRMMEMRVIVPGSISHGPRIWVNAQWKRRGYPFGTGLLKKLGHDTWSLNITKKQQLGTPVLRRCRCLFTVVPAAQHLISTTKAPETFLSSYLTSWLCEFVFVPFPRHAETRESSHSSTTHMFGKGRRPPLSPVEPTARDSGRRATKKILRRRWWPSWRGRTWSTRRADRPDIRAAAPARRRTGLAWRAASAPPRSRSWPVRRATGPVASRTACPLKSVTHNTKWIEWMKSTGKFSLLDFETFHEGKDGNELESALTKWTIQLNIGSFE